MPAYAHACTCTHTRDSERATPACRRPSTRATSMQRSPRSRRAQHRREGARQAIPQRRQAPPGCGCTCLWKRPTRRRALRSSGHWTWPASARLLSARRKRAAHVPSRPPDARSVPATLNASELTCAALQRCSHAPPRSGAPGCGRRQRGPQPCTSLNAPSRCDLSALLLQRFVLLQSPAPRHLAPSSTRGPPRNGRRARAPRAAPATGRPCRRRRRWQPGLLEQSSRQPRTPRLREPERARFR